MCRAAWLIAAVVAGQTLLLHNETASAQHLWWDLEGQKDATCLYGEIQVLATHPGIYYCGANWHPGEPAGGYCGIQHNGPNERRTIFSIWDTSPELHPKVTRADSQTIFNRFGGEGTGAHTHMLWPWQIGETVRFFARKSAGEKGDTTDASYFIFDAKRKKWLPAATIACPNGGKKSVETFSGGLNSFLENFTGKDRDEPKLALYRLWIGLSARELKRLTKASGDRKWGVLDDAYYLAEGSDDNLTALFAKLEREHGKPKPGNRPGGGNAKLEPIFDRSLPAETVKALENVPQAKPVGKP